jgi:hypothetical protein
VQWKEPKQIKINYTDYIEDKGIFYKNSEAVNLSLISFEIIDFYLSLPKNKVTGQISKGKKLVLNEERMAQIVQLLLTENDVLIRCVLKLVFLHFLQEKALYLLITSGLVEFLIL